MDLGQHRHHCVDSAPYLPNGNKVEMSARVDTPLQLSKASKVARLRLAAANNQRGCLLTDEGAVTFTASNICRNMKGTQLQGEQVWGGGETDKP